MTVGIYCIENIIAGKRYIGKSKNIERRFADHKRMLKREIKAAACNPHLWNSVKKYGITNFIFSILEKHLFLDAIRLSERELYWQDFYQVHNRDFGYNLLRESGGVTTHSEETRKLMSDKQIGKKRSLEHRQAISRGQTGRERSKVWCKAISEATVGRVISEKQRADISKTLSGRSLSEEHRKNISKGNMGRVVSPETRDAISRANTGRVHNKELYVNQREAVSKYSYCQYTIEGELLCIYNRMADAVNKGYIADNITSACSGKQKTYKGFIWVKIPKIVQDKLQDGAVCESQK